jgi:hypothetical protein
MLQPKVGERSQEMDPLTLVQQCNKKLFFGWSPGIEL